MNYDQAYYQSVYQQHIHQNDYHFKLSKFYMHNIFESNGFHLQNKTLLDYGSGPGHLTLSVMADCYDISPYITEYLMQHKRVAYTSTLDIPDAYYDCIRNSHSLEHCEAPLKELETMHQKLKSKGVLALILPIEKIPGNPTSMKDIHQHLYAWNFQNITNLLTLAGFQVHHQKVIYGPTGLKYLKNLRTIQMIGKLKRIFPYMLTIAQKL
jgi:ubiquinone/menaquinone biosynthesis C-methylase UbiE